MKDIPLIPDLLQGAVSFERRDGGLVPWRLPFEKLALYPPEPLQAKAAEPAGVRLRFATESQTISLDFDPLPEKTAWDLTLDGELMQTAAVDRGAESVKFADLPGGRKTIELYLPHNAPVCLRRLQIDPETDAEVVDDPRPKWVTYGSSITHCRAAHSPSRTWPATAARILGWNLTCLGYGGQCHLEPMVARMIRDLPADFITLKVGINIYGGGSLNARTFRPALIGFVQTIRGRHPRTPLAVISPIVSPPRESDPNPVNMTLRIMRNELREAVGRMVDSGDDNLHYADGQDLFGADLVDEYLPDALHPSGDGYEVMGRNFVRLVQAGPLKGVAPV